MSHAANVATANAAKAICRARRLEHYRAQDRERKRRQRLEGAGKINAIGRAADQRRRDKLKHFTKEATAHALAPLPRGGAIVTTRELAAPLFIFELNGVRNFESWTGSTRK